MKRFILFLVRKKLKLKKNQIFQFENQRSNYNFYYFTDDGIMKVDKGIIDYSGVSLNWLLDDKCRIVILDGSVLPR